MSGQPRVYQIRIQGQLDEEWSGWLEGLAIHHQTNGETVLEGPLEDQAALYGVLLHLHDLGLSLLEVRQITDTSSSTSSG